MAEWYDSLNLPQLETFIRDPRFRDLRPADQERLRMRLRSLQIGAQTPRPTSEMEGMAAEVRAAEEARTAAQAQADQRAREAQRYFEQGRNVIPIQPVVPSAPSGAEIEASVARPPARPPSAPLGGDRPYTPYVDLPVTGERATSGPSAPVTPDPFADIVNRYLSGGGGGGGMRFTPFTPSKPIDESAVRARLAKGMPEERKPEETYKADPYMTMLQTGLKILAAEPRLGQSAISAIAAPIGAGVEQYRGEREKERASKREEAKEARAEAFRQYETQRNIEGKLLELDEAQRTRNIAEQQLRFDIEKGVSGSAREASRDRLERAKFELDAARARADLREGDRYRLFESLELERTTLEAIPENRRTPEQRARLESIPRLQDAATRAFGITRAADIRAGALTESQRIAALESVRKELADHNKSPDIGSPEWTRRRDELLQRQMKLSETAPTALPPPPR